MPMRMPAVHTSKSAGQEQHQQHQQQLLGRGPAVQVTPRVPLARLPPKTPQNLLDELMDDELVSLDGL
jgi:hypothetical protein